MTPNRLVLSLVALEGGPRDAAAEVRCDEDQRDDARRRAKVYARALDVVGALERLAAARERREVTDALEAALYALARLRGVLLVPSVDEAKAAGQLRALGGEADVTRDQLAGFIRWWKDLAASCAPTEPEAA